MKKKKTNLLLTLAVIIMGALVMTTFNSCDKDDDPAEDPIASFQYEISEDNHLQVAFLNFSQHAETYSWNFGDGNTSTEENPVHIYDGPDDYEVVLTATNRDGVSATFAQVITVDDPFEALARLAGETSKTWKLYRVGSSMGVGPNAEDARIWWELFNDGSRPCLYYHEFTFTRDYDFIFDDNGSFWGEDAIFGGENPTDVHGTCFEATAANMLNNEGVDVSAWLSGTHAFEYEPSTHTVTLNGMGAWLGMPQLGTTGDSNVPVASKSFQIRIEEHNGYDLMVVSYTYAELYWDFTYAYYHDPALEPEVIEEPDPVEDLETITPTELGHTFESETSFDHLGAFDGGSIITVGADDPTDAAATKVGEFTRTADQYQEAQIRVYPEPKDILFDNFTTVSIDVYLPSTNTYDPLTKKVIIGFGDVHGDGGNWWQNLIQYESDELALDTWVTVTFDLDSPTYSAVVDGQTVYDRDNLDMVFIQIGGGDHTSEGTFFIRNLIFE